MPYMDYIIESLHEIYDIDFHTYISWMQQIKENIELLVTGTDFLRHFALLLK